MRSFLASAALLSSFAPCLGQDFRVPPNYCEPTVVTTFEQSQRFNEFVHLSYIEKNLTKAYQNYVDASYIQHNPFIGSGGAAAIEGLAAIFLNVTTTFLHVTLDNGIGIVHYKASEVGSVPTAIVDIYRWNGSCIAEHWDVIEALPANATNPLAFF